MNTAAAKPMSKSLAEWKVERTICSEPAKAIDLIRELLGELDKGEWANRDVFGIHMAMEESLMNAIKHGNCDDANKCVRVKIELAGNRFYARITDEGEGFDITAVPDPTQTENLECESGRGVALIKNFVDRVTYNPKGNSIELFKSLTTK